MSEALLINMPDELRQELENFAKAHQQSLETVVLERLQSRVLPEDIQNELDALRFLSDDALWTIAREQMSRDVQVRADELMTKNNTGSISPDEYVELERYAERVDRLSLRKAEAALLLKKRGYSFTQADFKSND